MLEECINDSIMSCNVEKNGLTEENIISSIELKNNL